MPAKHRLLTQLAVDKLKPRPGRRYELPDGPAGVPGFALRVSERGVKTFAIRYRTGGKQRRLTLGSAAILSLAEARQRARDALALVERGEDPAEGQREQEANSVAAVAAEYVARHARPKMKRWRAVELMLQRDVVPAWRDRPLASIAKRDVIRLVDGIVDRGAPVSANRTLSLVKRLFSWAIARGIVETNPAAGVAKPHRERPRARTLSEDEIRRVWAALVEMGWPFGDIGRLLLLTAQRRSEVAGMRWDQVDFERAVWTLPAASTKTEAEHIVPLAPPAVEILRQVPRIGGSALVFPSARATSTKPVSGFAKPLAAAQRLSGTRAWTWHDCRRTVRSNMGRLGVQPHIGERVLNHAVGSDVARVYDLHTYLPEVRAALLLWSAEIERIVAGAESKIVARPRR
jgi:integrase